MKLFKINGLPKDVEYEDIQHWGIKGQKWGIRRYQNPDGSLTPEGKKRYLKNGQLSAKGRRKIDSNKYDEYVKKEENRRANVRLQVQKNSETLKSMTPDVVINPVGDTAYATVKRKVGNATVNVSAYSLENDDLDFEIFSDASDNPKKYHDAAKWAMTKLIKDESEGVKDFLAYSNTGKTDDEIVESLSDYVMVDVHSEGYPIELIVNGKETGYHDWVMEVDPKTMNVIRDYFDG